MTCPQRPPQSHRCQAVRRAPTALRTLPPTGQHISPCRSASPSARRSGPRCRVPATRASRPRAIARIPSICSSARPRPACRSWYRSATAACSSRRSPSTAARALMMANDLAQTPGSGLHGAVLRRRPPSNFGVFASPERRLIFDLNDFDETLPGPWKWDVKRLAATCWSLRATGVSAQGSGAGRPGHGRGSTAQR